MHVHKAIASLLVLLPGVAGAAEWQFDARLGTELVEQGVSLTAGEPGIWLHGEFGDDTGLFAGLDAHNIDFVPNGALDRNLFIRLAPYVGWRQPLGDDFRFTGVLRWVTLPDAIPDTDYAVLELAADWRDTVQFSVNHAPDRFSLDATTAYELAGTWRFNPGWALRGHAGWHDFDAVGADDYSYAGLGLVASTPRFDFELAYHWLDGAGDDMFAAVDGEPGFVLTITGHQWREAATAALAPEAKWLQRLSMSAQLRSQYVSSGTAQTFGSPAVQLAVEYAWPNGTYVEVWGSNVDYVPDGGNTDGADVEIDYTLGHIFALGEHWKLGARVSLYTYPGAVNRDDDWDEHEVVVDATWDGRLRLKAGYVANTAGVGEPRSAYAVRWKQPFADVWSAALEVGHKDKRDWGQSYNWSMFELGRKLGPVTAMARYWVTSHSGRKDNGTADPTWEFALGWGL